EDDQILRPRAFDGCQGHCGVERHELPAVLNGETQKVDVGELLVTTNARHLEQPWIAERDIVRPKLVRAVFAESFKETDQIREGHDTVDGRRTTEHATRRV